MTRRFDVRPIRTSSEEPLDLKLALANACCFIPVYLRPHYFAACQTHVSESLTFPPASSPISLLQSRTLPDTPARGNGLDGHDLTKDFKAHWGFRILSRLGATPDAVSDR